MRIHACLVSRGLLHKLELSQEKRMDKGRLLEKNIQERSFLHSSGYKQSKKQKNTNKNYQNQKQSNKPCKPLWWSGREKSAPLKPPCSSSSHVLHVQAAGRITDRELVVVVFRQTPISSPNINTNPRAHPWSLYIKISSQRLLRLQMVAADTSHALTVQASVHCEHPDLPNDGYSFQTPYNLLSSLHLFSRHALVIYTCPQPCTKKKKGELGSVSHKRHLHSHVWGRMSRNKIVLHCAPFQLLSLDFAKSILKLHG